ALHAAAAPVPVLQAQADEEKPLQDLQAALSSAPTGGPEARLAHVVMQTVRHLRATVVRLYGWTPDESDGNLGGGLVLLTTDLQSRPVQAMDSTAPAPGSSRPTSASESLDLPGRRVTVASMSTASVEATAVASSAARQPAVSLLQQAVLTKAPAVYHYRQGLSGEAAGVPTDCAADHATLGATSFAALPLHSGDRLMGVLWIAVAPASPAAVAVPRPLHFSPALLRQVSNAVSLCLAGTVEPDYVTWLAGALRRALVGELCDAAAQHLRRRFLLEAVVHAALVPLLPDGGGAAQVGYMLDHRPSPGGPGSLLAARWGSGAALAALKQAGLTSSIGVSRVAATASTPPLSGHSPHRTDSGINAPQQSASNPSTKPSRTAAASVTRAASNQQQAMEPGAARGETPREAGGSAKTVAAVATGALPSLRAKGFQMSHTLLQRMVATGVAEGARGLDGVYAGLTVADCGRHVQDVHQPSRDVCILMAGGVRGADMMTTDASDSNAYASERSTGRICMQSLALVGVDLGSATGMGAAGACAAGGSASGTAVASAGARDGATPSGSGSSGAVLALYLTFPFRLPPLLMASSHASIRHLLSVMLARLLRRKVASELAAEYATLCAGVPGSYAVVPSASGGQNPIMREPHGREATLLLEGSIGTMGGASAWRADPAGSAPRLEPSIGTAGSSQLVPLLALMAPGSGRLAAPAALNGSVGLLAAFTDAGVAAAPRAAADRNPGSPGKAAAASQTVAVSVNGHSTQRMASLRLQDPLLGADGAGSLGASPEADLTGTREADLMLSSDPLVDGSFLDPDGEDAGVEEGGGTNASKNGGKKGAGRERGPADPSDPGGRGRSMAPAPAAVLTVSEADGTDSMRNHMGLLVESIMATLRNTAQMNEHFDGAKDGERQSLDLDLELEDLRLSGVLGDGGSGVVLCGMLATVPVAVKIIQIPEVDKLLLAKTRRPAIGSTSASAKEGRPGAGADPRAATAASDQAGKGPRRLDGGGGEGGNGQVEGGGDANQERDGRRSDGAPSELHQAQRDMLRNATELAVMRSISHVNIVQVYAVYNNVVLERLRREGGSTSYTLRRPAPGDMQPNTPEAKPVFVALCMELCDSGSLASKLEERTFPRVLQPHAAPDEGPSAADGIAAAQRARLPRRLDMMGIYLTLLEVACALRYLHARHLIHRDVKSANILLKASPTDPRGWTCKLADFGSAIVLDQYQPPEEQSASGRGTRTGDDATSEPSSGGGGGGGVSGWFTIQEQSWGT
ncbi:hypothetical protein TSOC_008829, partial [Tetrabaena socialis]